MFFIHAPYARCDRSKRKYNPAFVLHRKKIEVDIQPLIRPRYLFECRLVTKYYAF